MNIRDYLNTNMLATAIHQGYVRMQTFGPLAVYNYTPKAQYEHMWNDITRKCRGLIVDRNTGIVLARPFPKFFNWGEVDRDMLPCGEITVTEKMDGSLGILYEDRYTNKLRIATRGSFTSEQATHATEVLHSRYEDFRPYAGFTYLFEIIYPQNRIVVDYGSQDDLVLLEVLNTETGLSVLNTEINNWPGPVAEQYTFKCITDVIEVQRENAEGFVVMYPDGFRVKVKHDDYVRLHRLVTGVSTKTIWELLSLGKDVSEILEHVPDEFYRWVKSEVKDLQGQHQRISKASWTAFLNEFARADTYEWGSREHRKEFAGLIADSEFKGLHWAYYDDKPVESLIWKLIKPEYSKPFWNQTDEVA